MLRDVSNNVRYIMPEEVVRYLDWMKYSGEYYAYFDDEESIENMIGNWRTYDGDDPIGSHLSYLAKLYGYVPEDYEPS